MKIKVRRETARCTNCGKINEFYYLSDFLYGERLVIFHNGMSYAYINLLEDDVYNDFIDKVKTILNLHQKEFSEEKLQNIKLELPGLPDLEDINVNRLSKKRDEKIIEEIIKPKDNLINDLYQDNLILQQELSRQARTVEKAEKYQRERDKMMEDNENLHNEVEQIRAEYKQKERDIEWKYKSKIKGLEKENSKLHRIVDKFYETIDKFIHWICKKFDMSAEDNLIRDFQKETNTLLNAEKQIEKENREKEFEMEL